MRLTALLVILSSAWFASVRLRLAPRRGSTIIAQGKAAEAAALGTSPPPPISLFSKLCWPSQHNFEKREVFILRI